MKVDEEQLLKKAGQETTLSPDRLRGILRALPLEKPQRSRWSWGLLGVPLMAGLVVVFVLSRPEEVPQGVRVAQEAQAAPWDEATLIAEQQGLTEALDGFEQELADLN